MGSTSTGSVVFQYASLSGIPHIKTMRANNSQYFCCKVHTVIFNHLKEILFFQRVEYLLIDYDDRVENRQRETGIPHFTSKTLC